MNEPPKEDGEKPVDPASIVPAGDETEEEALQAILEPLPPEQQRVLRAVLSHSGPLPDPTTLARYDHVIPGLAERIVRLTEGEQEHRHRVVEKVVERDNALRDRGQHYGMIALILTLAFCVYLAAIGNPSASAMVAVGLIAAVVGIFVTGRKEDTRHMEIQQQQDQEG